MSHWVSVHGAMKPVIIFCTFSRPATGAVGMLWYAPCRRNSGRAPRDRAKTLRFTAGLTIRSICVVLNWSALHRIAAQKRLEPWIPSSQHLQ